jgi:hypothetical protein
MPEGHLGEVVEPQETGEHDRDGCDHHASQAEGCLAPQKNIVRPVPAHAQAACFPDAAFTPQMKYCSIRPSATRSASVASQ